MGILDTTVDLTSYFRNNVGDDPLMANHHQQSPAGVAQRNARFEHVVTFMLQSSANSLDIITQKSMLFFLPQIISAIHVRSVANYLMIRLLPTDINCKQDSISHLN